MSRLPVRRPTLIPALRRVWRGPDKIQFGTDPVRAVLLEFSDPLGLRFLDLLDGSRTEPALLAEAKLLGIHPEAATAMLATLRQAGLVTDAHLLRPTGLPEPARRRLAREASALAVRGTEVAPAAALRRRTGARVLITGSSQLAVPIAAALAAAGVGHVDPDVDGVARVADACPGGLLPNDAHRPRAVAAAEAVRRVAPEVNLSPLRAGQATFAVLVGHRAPGALTALRLDLRKLAHLTVWVRDGSVVIGPLVRPGRTACLNCLDLHRTERDPAWPAVMAQLITTGDGDPLTTATALAGTAFAAAEVLSYLDTATASTMGATVDIGEPGECTRRQWSAHPRCGCLRRTKSRTSEPPARPAECFN